MSTWRCDTGGGAALNAPGDLDMKTFGVDVRLPVPALSGNLVDDPRLAAILAPPTCRVVGRRNDGEEVTLARRRIWAEASDLAAALRRSLDERERAGQATEYTDVYAVGGGE